MCVCLKWETIFVNRCRQTEIHEELGILNSVFKQKLTSLEEPQQPTIRDNERIQMLNEETQNLTKQLLQFADKYFAPVGDESDQDRESRKRQVCNI